MMNDQVLNDEILAKYEAILLKEKELTENLINRLNIAQENGLKENSGDASSYMIHQADMGTDTDDSEKQVFILDKEYEKLKKINAALHRIFDKTYGVCPICGEFISEKRLSIVPYAKLCIKCKSEDEKNHK